jgi:uncharacterized protein YgiM (DUF1202 family)
MRKALFLALIFTGCSTAPAPVTAPQAPLPAVLEPISHTVQVTASVLNVRREPSSEAEAIAQVRRGVELGVLSGSATSEDDSWVRVRLVDGTEGWVAARFVAREGELAVAAARREKKGGCPADSDYAFLTAPTPAFSEGGQHGVVVVEANVNAKGTVTATRLISNVTGVAEFAALAEREVKEATFSPPIRDCEARAFIFTYRRTF